MLEYILTIIIILAVWFVYSCIVKPKKLYNSYLNHLLKTPYKVYVQPFQSLGMPFFKIIQKDQK
jgi:hypothetical protein